MAEGANEPELLLKVFYFSVNEHSRYANYRKPDKTIEV